MTKLTIAYAPDDKYMNMTIISMISTIDNNQNTEIEFLILYSKLSEKSFEKLRNIENKYNCKIRYIEIEESEFNDLPMSNWVTVQAWFRIKIPDLCPDLERVLYLDCDTMINGNLEELFTLNFKDNYVAAVKDVWNVNKQTKRLKMKSDSYFNSGMLLMNCKKFREDKIVDKIKEYSVKYKKIIKFCDQDTLNKIIDEKKINLPAKYNFMDTWWRNYYLEYEGEDLANYKEAQKNPVIVHLTGLKPDVKGCKNIMNEKWWAYARISDIYEEIQEKYNSSVEPIKKKKPISKIFNIKNEYRYKDKWKVLTLFGIKIKFRLERAEKVFVIFNTAFIGDILLNNVLAQNIKMFYPDSKVVFVVQSQFEDVAKYQKGVDEVITFNKKKNNNLFGILKFIKKFPYKNIFASFIIYSNDRNLIIARLLKSKHIITTQKSLFTKLMSTKEKFKNKKYVHVKDESTGLLECLTGKVKLDLPIIYNPPFIEIEELKNKKNIISICTTSKFKPKDMDAKTTKKIIKNLNKNNYTPVLLGKGEAAREFVDELKKLKCTDFVDMVDKTNFVELANLLQKSEALISVDTGTMHLGNAVNCPTVALFYTEITKEWAPQKGLYKSVVLNGSPQEKEIIEGLNIVLEKSKNNTGE